MQIDYDKINKIDTKNLDIFKPNKKLYFALAQKDKVDFIYNTSALEGNAMTYPEVATLLEGVTIGGHKLSDEQQILNQNRSVTLLFELIKNDKFKLDKPTLLKLHKKVAFEEALNWGKFRNSGVHIGGTEYLPPKALTLDEIFKNNILNISKISNKIIQAISYFLFGASCQFFYDGNKRVSRLIMNGILLNSGYPILNIKAKDKLEFNQIMIKFYDTQNIYDAIDYLQNYYYNQNKILVD
jgi:Fic family protein